MTNLVDAYWDVDGVSLDSYATNIQTFGGSRSGVPGFRGENTKFSTKRGSEHRRKLVDDRVITLALTVTGYGTDGSGPPTKQKFVSNWRALQRLLWRPNGDEFDLTKRWDEGSGTVTATAKAAFESGLEPTMSGPMLAKTTVDLRLADPFFYTAEQSSSLAVGVATTINNPGDDNMTKIVMEVNGVIANPKVTNSTPLVDVWTKLGLSLGSGGQAIVDVDNATVTRNTDGANLVGTLSHSGARYWMGLLRGNNTLTLTADSGTGTVNFRYQVPYF